MWQKRISVVVIILIGVLLVSILLPALLEQRETARKQQSKMNLRQIGWAIFNYESAYKSLPPGGVFDLEGRGYTGWMVSLIPFFDASPARLRIDDKEPWNSAQNAGNFLGKITPYQNPGEPQVSRHWEFPLAHYSANSHVMGINSFIKLDAIANRSQVFLAGELDGDFVPWGCPYNWRELHNINADPPTYGRSTRDGCQFVFGDGRVEFVANGISKEVLNALNGEDLTEFEANPFNVHRPAEFPCPTDAIWIHPESSPEGLVLVKKDIHGKVVSQEEIKSNK